MEYYLYLDETGDHGLSYIDQNFPIFLLCGCVVSLEHLPLLEKQVNEFKQMYFHTTDVILHSRDVRKCEGPFQILFDLDIKKKFYGDLNKILTESNYSLIGSAVHKERHIKRYGKWASNLIPCRFPLSLRGLSFCWILRAQQMLLTSLRKNGVKRKTCTFYPTLIQYLTRVPIMYPLHVSKKALSLFGFIINGIILQGCKLRICVPTLWQGIY